MNVLHKGSKYPKYPMRKYVAEENMSDFYLFIFYSYHFIVSCPIQSKFDGDVCTFLSFYFHLFRRMLKAPPLNHHKVSDMNTLVDSL